MTIPEPLRDLLFVELISPPETSTGIILPESGGKRYIKVKVIKKGFEIKNEHIKEGLSYLAENMFEPFPSKGSSTGFILEQYLLAKVI